jgi:hypothetical protein
MNALETHIQTHNLPMNETLDKLQENGVISYLCSTVDTVCDSDCLRAVEWLKGETVC